MHAKIAAERVFLVVLITLCAIPARVLADINGYELVYDEKEQGADPYQTRLIVTDRYLRIDDLSDTSGYILFDNKAKKIYSVSDFDKSTYVIEDNVYQRPPVDPNLATEEKLLHDAPKVADTIVHDYQVIYKAADKKNLCTHIQYVPGLLPSVGKMMHAYQQIISGNEVKTLARIPVEYQTPCMLSDQVYNQGDYYIKGLVIMEWHSNGKQRYLENYKPVQVDAGLFELPKGYRQFSNE
jgi:hypothetical protein